MLIGDCFVPRNDAGFILSKNILYYSLRKLSTGLASAALTD
ncbi:YSIRK-type signal peptide-containing protein [Mucilaginibacter sp. 3215]